MRPLTVPEYVAQTKKKAALTFSDLCKIEAALRLRVEACEQNGELSYARSWELTRRRVERMIRGGE